MATGMDRPTATEYAPCFARYVDRVPGGDIVVQLRTNSAILNATFNALEDTRGAYRPAKGKWSVREMLGDLIDVERIFVYRALHIARGGHHSVLSLSRSLDFVGDREIMYLSLTLRGPAPGP
jgi:hypothetical protein